MRRTFVIGINAVLVLGALLVGVRAVGAYRASHAASVVSKLIEPGMRISIAGVDWSTADLNVVLLTSATCKACIQSAPSYRAMAEKIRSVPDSRLIAVSLESVDKTRQWLRDQHVDVAQVLQLSSATSLGFSVYPTLLVVDSNGLVTDIFLGSLVVLDTNQLLGRITRPVVGRALNNTEYVPELTLTEAIDLFGATTPQLIDARGRKAFAADHQPGVLNIPADELMSRGQTEADPSKPVGVMCYEDSMVACRAAGKMLRSMGFSRVVLIVN